MRYLGVTHYTTSAHPDSSAVMEREKLDFVQFNYSPVTREAEKRLLPLCAERGVAVLVNRPFEDGDLFQRVRGKALPAWAAELRRDELGAAGAEVRAAHPAVTCVIPATGKVAHLDDNLGRRLADACPTPGSARRSRSSSLSALRAPAESFLRRVGGRALGGRLVDFAHGRQHQQREYQSDERGSDLPESRRGTRACRQPDAGRGSQAADLVLAGQLQDRPRRRESRCR